MIRTLISIKSSLLVSLSVDSLPELLGDSDCLFTAAGE
jgi:hypothetical protein